MPDRYALLLAVGLTLFCAGALSRTYMTIMIHRSPLRVSTVRSTEVRYRRLIRGQGARVWPLLVTMICIPLGIVVTIAAIILSNHATAQ